MHAVVQQNFSDQKERLGLFYSKCTRSKIPRPLHFCLFRTLCWFFNSIGKTSHLDSGAAMWIRCCQRITICPLKMTRYPYLLKQESLALIYFTVTILLPADPIPLQSVPYPTALLYTWTLADYNPVFLSSDKSSQSQPATHMYHCNECFLLSFQTIMPQKKISTFITAAKLHTIFLSSL